MLKYQFKIKARNGLVVENLFIQGQDREDAERKLFQMYVGCTVLECVEVAATTGRDRRRRGGGMDMQAASVGKFSGTPGNAQKRQPKRLSSSPVSQTGRPMMPV